MDSVNKGFANVMNLVQGDFIEKISDEVTLIVARAFDVGAALRDALQAELLPDDLFEEDLDEEAPSDDNPAIQPSSTPIDTLSDLSDLSDAPAHKDEPSFKKSKKRKRSETRKANKKAKLDALLQADAKEAAKVSTKKKNAKSRPKRKEKRIEEGIKKAENFQYGRTSSRKGVDEKHKAQATPIFTNVDISASHVTSTGFTTFNDTTANLEATDAQVPKKKVFPYAKRVYTTEEMLGPKFKFKHVRYEKGGKAMPLVDRNGQMFGCAIGQPADNPDWDKEAQEATKAFDEARRTASTNDTDQTPRHGEFKTMRTGVSHGGGQTQPSNLKNTGKNAKAIEKLNKTHFFQRLAKFTSDCFNSWAPNLAKYYKDTLSKLFKHDPSLNSTFGTVFTATTYNLGPHTLCFPHLDFANLAFGWCSITALGNFDYKKGGQVILWEAGLIIDLPPGSTLLLASALIHHSNTAIAKGETRYSFTQYSAGALFRWVDHEFMTTAEWWATNMKARNIEKMRQMARMDAQRWKMGMVLTPKHSLKIKLPACK